jgi:hypothetical protein
MNPPSPQALQVANDMHMVGGALLVCVFLPMAIGIGLFILQLFFHGNEK